MSSAPPVVDEIRQALQRMRANVRNAEVQAKGCEELGDVAARDDLLASAVGREGGIECIIAAMRTHPGHVNLQRYGCRALINIARHPENRPLAATAGGIEAVVTAMRSHPGEGVQRYGCSALANIALHEGNESLVAKAGGIEAVLRAMRAHPGVKAVQQHGCRALDEITAIPENQPLVANAGGIETVAAAMRSHLDSAEVQEPGCGALGNVSAHTDFQSAVAKAGGIEVVVKAMRAHLGHEGIQRDGCMALGNIAEHPGNLPLLTQKGGIEAVVAALRTHRGNAAVQEYASLALGNIAAHPGSQPRLVRAGGIEAVVTAMQSHPEDEDVQRSGCEALTKIIDVDLDENCSATLTAAGGIGAVVHAMRTHEAVVPVQRFGCRVLGDVSVFQGPAVLKAGGIEAVVRAMESLPYVADLQGEGCRALVNLSVQRDHRPLIARMHGVEAIMTAHDSHPRNEDVVLYAEWALGVLAANANIRAALTQVQVEAGLRRLITDGVERLMDDELFLFCNMSPLCDISQDPACHPLIVSCGAVPTVVKAMIAQPASGRVQLCGVRMLNCLARGSEVGWNAVGTSAQPEFKDAMAIAGDMLCKGVKRASKLTADEHREGSEAVQALLGMEAESRRREERSRREREAQRQQQLDQLLHGLLVPPEVRDILMRNDLITAPLLQAVEVSKLTELGMTVGVAMTLKNHVNSPRSKSAGGAAAVAPSTGSPAEQKLRRLLTGLDIPSDTFSDYTYAKLAQHEYTTAGSLRHASVEELKELGITRGQIAEIKRNFRSEDSGGAAAAAAAPRPPSPPIVAAAAAAAGPRALVLTPGPPASFAVSNFKRVYDSLRPVEVHYELFRVVHKLITSYCLLHGQDTAKGDAFFGALSEESMAKPKELLNRIDAASQRVWTTKERLLGCGPKHELELCSIINFAIRTDHPDLITAAAQLARNINCLCVTRRIDAAMFPPHAFSFRGSSLPNMHRDFFTPGKQYRVPGFLATSFDEGVAYGFLIRAHGNGTMPVVLWRVRFDPRGATDPRFRCRQVNYVQHSNIQGEKEYLFAPFSTFTVHKVEWKAGDDINPHVIDLVAALDNRLEPEDLPLAPWY